MSEERTLAKQFNEEREALETLIGDALLDFTERTGFVVKEVIVFYRNPHGGLPDYAVQVNVTI